MTMFDCFTNGYLKPVTEMPDFEKCCGKTITIDSMGDSLDSLVDSARYVSKYLDGVKISNDADIHVDTKVYTRHRYMEDDFYNIPDDCINLVEDIINQCEQFASDTIVETLVDFGVTTGNDLAEMFLDKEKTKDFISVYNQKIDFRPDREFFQMYKLELNNDIVRLSDEQIKGITDFIQDWLKKRGYYV